MNRYLAVGLIFVAALWVSGCVSKGNYADAIEEVDVAKTELDRERQRKAALEEQVKTLKELNAKLGQEAQLVKDELQRIEHSRDQERGGIAERNKQMERQVRTLVAQHRALRKQYQDLKRRNKSLRSTVARYQKELKERTDTGGTSTKVAKAPVIPPKPGAPPKVVTPPAAVKTPRPAPAAPSGPGRGGTVNLNKASVGDMMTVLGLPKDVAERVVSNRPYRIKGELVAKNVMSKQTFDGIKGRITVRQ